MAEQDRPLYQTTYTDSWALVIGINRYEKAPPLGYARNDAEAFALALQERFDFKRPALTTLFDEEATKDKILSEFLKLATASKPDDRVIVFFAGHGHTLQGYRGEVGYLVPVGGDAANLSSLIRWDDFTRNAELIPAKHMLFIMDACYGGLMLQRNPPGSMRFAKDMLQRYSRQVLTAGKADETVADAGGPRPGHSIFTGHLLDGLYGAATSAGKIITANGVMAYVYEKVGKDQYSHQTPHYGFFDGDGDLIFDLGALEGVGQETESDEDILVASPVVTESSDDSSGEEALLNGVKDLISESKYHLRLHDLVAHKVRQAISKLGDDVFPVSTHTAPDPAPEEFSARLKRYEATIHDLALIVAVLARWGSEEQRRVLQLVFERLPDAYKSGDGYEIWMSLRWYPVEFLLYTSGIAALDGGGYDNLTAALMAKVAPARSGSTQTPIFVPTIEEMLDITRSNMFKRLPGHERQRTPKSEYLFKALQPRLEDILFLGTSYEGLFDRFEVLYALVMADHKLSLEERAWGPVGRFGWKHYRGGGPFAEIVREAESKKDDWGPIRAGLFGGSYAQFKKAADGYLESLNGLNWF